jgi:ethanolamine ammonia-lyase large subunit
VLGLKPAPEFEDWLQKTGIFEPGERPRLREMLPQPFERALAHIA